MPFTQTSPEKKKTPLPLIIGGVVVLGGIAAFFIFHHGDDDGGAPVSKSEIKMVSLPPPPPPPPPPPKQEPPPPDAPKFQKEEAPTDEKPPDKAPEPAPLATSIQGNDASGLASGNGGGGGFGGGGMGGGRGSKFGYYAGQVKSRMVNCLLGNKKTRSAVMDVQVRVWLDETGRVSKVSLAKSTGNPDVDNAIRSEAFSELSMPEPPPAGMLMPIVMHFSAKRPN